MISPFKGFVILLISNKCYSHSIGGVVLVNLSGSEKSAGRNTIGKLLLEYIRKFCVYHHHAHTEDGY